MQAASQTISISKIQSVSCYLWAWISRPACDVTRHEATASLAVRRTYWKTVAAFTLSAPLVPPVGPHFRSSSSQLIVARFHGTAADQRGNRFAPHRRRLTGSDSAGPDLPGREGEREGTGKRERERGRLPSVLHKLARKHHRRTSLRVILR